MRRRNYGAIGAGLCDLSLFESIRGDPLQDPPSMGEESSTKSYELKSDQSLTNSRENQPNHKP